MDSPRENFDLSGPSHITTIDWKNVEHQRSIAASLVQGVYILERDRHEKREGSQALAPPWWEFFHFKLYRQLVDDSNSSIFGAIYEVDFTKQDHSISVHEMPHYVIAFRGTIRKGDAFQQDLQLDFQVIRNGLHQTSRFEIAIQAVRSLVATFGNSNIWLAGHSLGSSMALLAGKKMAKTGVFLEAFLFNPPFLSAPIERIKQKKVKHGIRFAGSVITAGLAFTVNAKQKNRSEDPFIALSAWVPCLFVNPADHICSEYVGYFEHRKKMEEIGAGGIERLATQHSIGDLVMRAIGKESEEALHLIPSANLTVNLTPSESFKKAHGIHQWWRTDLNLQSKLYRFR
ncbi:Fungal lipase-like domain containing protein [Heracleum sosnowskyi]|uniref:Fungal lipase-like domain containing protein n=1 Tax=Heracleum sosnowskyi TaxID=360622 RepID=A0AAD8HII2_9APIA|nr:Fungal lipase-like domain containing protein [Heracleum sosnowskyi]